VCCRTNTGPDGKVFRTRRYRGPSGVDLAGFVRAGRPRSLVFAGFSLTSWASWRSRALFGRCLLSGKAGRPDVLFVEEAGCPAPAPAGSAPRPRASAPGPSECPARDAHAHRVVAAAGVDICSASSRALNVSEVALLSGKRRENTVDLALREKELPRRGKRWIAIAVGRRFGGAPRCLRLRRRPAPGIASGRLRPWASPALRNRAAAHMREQRYCRRCEQAAAQRARRCVGATLTLPGQESKFSHAVFVRASVARRDFISGNVVARDESGISGFASSYSQRSSAERRETGSRR